MTPDHLIALIKFIVEESTLLFPDDETGDKKVPTERQNSIANRVDLLMACIAENHSHLHKVVTYIRNIPITSK